MKTAARLNRNTKMTKTTDMAHATHTPAFNRALAGDRADSLFEALRTRWAQYRIYRQTVAELSALPDRELADLGLNRASIRHIAHKAAYEK